LSFQSVRLELLLVNPQNDRHGDQRTEKAAVAWLFSERGPQMMKLAEDIVEQGGVFDPPLVKKTKNKFVVYDGNRRVTCLKILAGLLEAPQSHLKAFEVLRARLRTHNQNMTVAASAIAERKTVGDLS
jgi:hypothetical protein